MSNGEKICPKCGEIKDQLKFCVDNHRPDGRASYCKSCHGSYYANNKERILKQYKQYRAEHKDRLSSNRKAFDKRRFFYKRASNLLTRRQGSSGKGEARKRLPEKCSEISRIWYRQRGVCPLSGRRLNRDNAHLDHIISIKKGGGDEIENLRWVHKDVNYAKRDLSEADFLILCSDIVNFSMSL